MRNRLFQSEVFAVRAGEWALLFAPLLGVIVRVDLAGVNLLRKLERDPEMGLRPADSEFLGRLAQLGLSRTAVGIELSRPDQTPFVPRCVSLYLTNACNLRCVYCYASAGEAPVPTTLDFGAGAAGIRYVADAVKRRGEDAFTVSFHGAGEPTVAWSSLVRLADYARRIAAQEGLRAAITTCTNGVMSAEHAVWLARHTDGAAVSLDGDATIQNALRPLRGGGGSFAQVARTLGIFREEGFRYSIRATITAANVRRMTAMVEQMSELFGGSNLQFDPVMVTGRCLEAGCGPVDPEVFVQEFMRAHDHAQVRGARLGFSILSLDSLRTYYCCAVSDGFTITHDGLVTSCFDVSRPDHPFAGRFIYGAYDPQTGQIQTDPQKLADLRCRNVCRLTACANCFCKYMCCGDCTTHAMRQGLAFMAGGGRCAITQALGAFLLLRKLAPAGQGVPCRAPAADRNDYTLASATWAEGHEEHPVCMGGLSFTVREGHYMRPLSAAASVRQSISAGNEAYRRHDFATALRQYEQAREVAPRLAEVRVNTALALHKLGRLPESLVEAESAVTLANTAPAAHLTLGKILAASGRLADALAACERALALDPCHPGARYNRAWVLAELGRVGEAEEVLAALVEVTGRGSDADVLLQSLRLLHVDERGAADHSLGGGTHAWMLALNSRLRSGEGVPSAPQDRAKLVAVLSDYSCEQYTRARRLLDELVQAHPASALLRGLSGMLWQAQGMPELATAELRLAEGVLGEHSVRVGTG